MGAVSQGKSPQQAATEIEMDEASMNIVQVALPVPMRRVFDYLLPDNLPQPSIGARVVVPLVTANWLVLWSPQIRSLALQ